MLVELGYIDFGRSGIHDVPLIKTDFIERTEQIRERNDLKNFPNLVTHFVGRLAFTEDGSIKTYSYDPTKTYSRWLLIVADVKSKAFEHAVHVLDGLDCNDDVMVCIFPQGDLSDREVAVVLDQLACESPFIIKFMRDAYTRTVLTDGVQAPAALVCTPNGKRLTVKALGRLEVADICSD